jgi:hypothetical protein
MKAPLFEIDDILRSSDSSVEFRRAKWSSKNGGSLSPAGIRIVERVANHRYIVLDVEPWISSTGESTFRYEVRMLHRDGNWRAANSTFCKVECTLAKAATRFPCNCAGGYHTCEEAAQ